MTLSLKKESDPQPLEEAANILLFVLTAIFKNYPTIIIVIILKISLKIKWQKHICLFSPEISSSLTILCHTQRIL
jgi:hypothetical protein